MVLSQEMLRRGQMEGRGIFKDVGKWLLGAAKKANKFLKKSKIISKAGPIVGSLVGKVYPQAGDIISKASKFAGQHGYGPARKCKNISPAQVQAMKGGYAQWMPSGGISLALARKHLSKNIKNITKAQVDALRRFFGRKMKGGGIRLSGGGPSGFYSVTQTAPNITGRGTSLPGVGGGVKLAGQGRKRRKPAVRGKKKILYY